MTQHGLTNIISRAHAAIDYLRSLMLCTLCFGLNSCAVTPTNNENPTYLDTNASIDTRVNDLISRMTLSEKIAQLYNEAPAIQHLNVPYYDWWNEALHGVARAGKATVFPQAIGMAATFNAPMMYDIASAISDEARAKHHYFANNGVRFRYTGLTFWSPNINIFRDPRWGRGQETYGEDPYLTGSMAVPFIKGLQGDDPKYLKVSAMAKHFAVHSGPEKSRHSDNYFVSPKDLRETYLPAFDRAVNEAKVESVMCAYNRVNNEPACGSEQLLKDILRGEWQFAGHVVSDCGAIADFYDPKAHALVKAPAQAAAWALKAGTDLNCGTARLSTYTNLHFALQRNMVSEQDIDRALARLLKTRFKLGMFDPEEKVEYSKIPITVVGSDKHLNLTLAAAQESFVLLKNDGILPLQGDEKIAVIGPNATNPAVLVGNYHGDPIAPSTPLEAIQNHLQEQFVGYAAGSSIVDNHYGHYSIIPKSNFFHYGESGQLKSGLVANYFSATTAEGIKGEAKITRIDPNIDFFWQRSPIDGSVWDEFGVTWEGYLKAPASGHFLFSMASRGFELSIDDKPIKSGQGVELKQGTLYRLSAKITYLRTWWGNNPVEPHAQLRWLNSSSNLTKEAIKVAKKADVIVFVAGISPQIEGEEMRVSLTGFNYGDRSAIDLPKPQRDVLKALKKLHKPIVLVNLSGSAMALAWEKNHANAILQGFYPGEATGDALVSILTGQVSPSGKLPVTFYSGVDDLPGFKDYSMHNRTYKYYQGTPLFAFGFGLSFTQFEFSSVRSHYDKEGTLLIEYDLTNMGETEGQEVSQLYMKLLDTPHHKVHRELVGFRKDRLAPKESKSLTIELKPEQLSFYDDQGVKHRYSGRVQFSLGGGQPEWSGSSNVLQWESDIAK